MTQPQNAPATSSRVPTGEPIWVDLTTSAPQQTRDFYAALFGWEYQIAEEMGGYTTASSGGHKEAGLLPPSPEGTGSSAPPPWVIYFDTKDIVADAERVKALGGTAFEGPIQIGNQGRAHHFSDPNGVTFGLWQDDQHGGFVQNTETGRLVWCEYNTRDLPRALGFYPALLRATSQQIPGLAYHTLHHGAQGFAGVSGSAENWQAVGAEGWMVYFYAPDPDEMIRTAQQHGGTVLVEPFDTPYGRMAVLSDPAGSVFTLMNPQTPGS